MFAPIFAAGIIVSQRVWEYTLTIPNMRDRKNPNKYPGKANNTKIIYKMYWNNTVQFNIIYKDYMPRQFI